MESEERRLAEEHFTLAEKHVSEGERLVEHQRKTIDERRREGHDVELPVKVLAEMEESLRLHIEGRDRLLRELTGDRPAAV